MTSGGFQKRTRGKFGGVSAKSEHNGSQRGEGLNRGEGGRRRCPKNQAGGGLEPERSRRSEKKKKEINLKYTFVQTGEGQLVGRNNMSTKNKERREKQAGRRAPSSTKKVKKTGCTRKEKRQKGNRGDRTYRWRRPMGGKPRLACRRGRGGFNWKGRNIAERTSGGEKGERRLKKEGRTRKRWEKL